MRSISAERGIEEIDFENFVTMFCQPADTEEKAKSVFKQYDIAGKGYADLEDFRRVTHLLKERYTDPEIELMFQHADKDHDGRVNFEEF